MADMVTFEEVAALAEKLSREEQVRLAQKLLHESSSSYQPRPGRKWAEIRGAAPYPLCVEDAQEWVSRTRRESDEHREKQWKHRREA
jgi:hypothetical protein